MEKVVSYILRLGVILSISIISFGLFAHIIMGFSSSNILIKAGLYILILTPFARLVASLIMFFIEKDRIYFLITLAIIVIILISNLIISKNV